MNCDGDVFTVLQVTISSRHASVYHSMPLNEVLMQLAGLGRLYLLKQCWLQTQSWHAVALQITKASCVPSFCNGILVSRHIMTNTTKVCFLEIS